MTKHTPGPWQACAGLGAWNVTTIGKPRTFNICAINTNRVGQEANARLIASAPDLLEALKVALNELHHPGAFNHSNPHDAPEVTEYLEAAIAKAEGR